ncbi:hypothetical protein [Tranquillimonas rosea]|uniref:hypothetical protein n=1 Tax=Tranquillimonas rosea TaxID=641238 RepID=UPI003BAAC681
MLPRPLEYLLAALALALGIALCATGGALLGARPIVAQGEAVVGLILLYLGARGLRTLFRR